MNEVLVPISVGDLIDRMAVLDLQTTCAVDTVHQAALRSKKALLDRLAERVLPKDPTFCALRQDLHAVRVDLRAIEQDLRACEERSDFGTAFVALAQAFFVSQDVLDRIKSDINDCVVHFEMSQNATQTFSQLRDQQN